MDKLGRDLGELEVCFILFFFDATLIFVFLVFWPFVNSAWLVFSSCVKDRKWRFPGWKGHTSGAHIQEGSIFYFIAEEFEGIRPFVTEELKVVEMARISLVSTSFSRWNFTNPLIRTGYLPRQPDSLLSSPDAKGWKRKFAFSETTEAPWLGTGYIFSTITFVANSSFQPILTHDSTPGERFCFFFVLFDKLNCRGQKMTWIKYLFADLCRSNSQRGTFRP